MRKRALELVVATTCAFGLLGACSSESAEDMLASAKGYLAKKDDKAAVLQLKNALQQKPDLAEARFLLAEVLLQRGDPVGAEVELRKARDLHYPEAQVVPLLAKSLFTAREFRKVLDQFGNTTLPDNAAQAELKNWVALSHAALGDMGRARSALQAALQAVPGHVAARVLEARFVAAERQPDKALALLDEVLATHPADKDALQFKGDLLLLKGDRDGALAAYRKVLAVDPSHIPARAGVIDQLLARRDVKAAEAEVAALRKSHPESAYANYYEAQLAFLTNDVKRAGELVEKVLRAVPNHAKALELAGAVELKNHSLVRAADYFNKALQFAPGLPAARRLLAQTYIQSGQPEKALATLEPVLSRSDTDAATLTIAANAEAQAGNLKRAEAYVVRAAKLDPNNPRSRVALAVDRTRGSGVEATLSEIETIAAAETGPYADFVLVNAHLRRGEFDKALKSVEAIAKKQPDKPYAANIRGRIHVLRRDMASARRSFEQALAIDPTFVPAAASLAMLDLQEQKPDDARRRFDKVLAADPKNSQALLALAGLNTRTGAPKDEVAKLLVRATTANPADLSARLALVNHHLQHGDGKQAVAAAQDGVAALPASPEMLDALARAQLASGERNQAIASFNRLATLQPSAPQPHLRIAAVHLEAKNHDEARRSVERALAAQPNNFAAQRALAEVEFKAGRTEEALAIVRNLRKQRPTDDDTYVLEGNIEVARKNLPAAAEAYRLGLKHAPSTQLAVRLHGVLGGMGKAAEADKFAASWSKEHPKDARFLAYLGERALSQRDYAAAEGYLRRVDEMTPNNAFVMNNLAWAMTQLNKPGAVGYAEKANALYPNKPVFMDTLAMALAAEKQTAKAIEVEKRALALAPDAHALRLSLAKIYIQAGDKAAARAELDKLAKLEAQFAAQDEVTKLRASL